MTETGTEAPTLPTMPDAIIEGSPVIDLLADPKQYAALMKDLNVAYTRANDMIAKVGPAAEITELLNGAREHRLAAESDAKATKDILERTEREAAEVRKTIIRQARSEGDEMLATARAGAEEIKTGSQAEVDAFDTARKAFAIEKTATEAGFAERDRQFEQDILRLTNAQASLDRDEANLKQRLDALNTAIRAAAPE